MVWECWKFSVANFIRRMLRLWFVSMLVSLFALSAHARVSPAHGASPGDPASPKGTPAPSATFGIVPSDSVFSGGGDSGWSMIHEATVFI